MIRLQRELFACPACGSKTLQVTWKPTGLAVDSSCRSCGHVLTAVEVQQCRVQPPREAPKPVFGRRGL